MCKLQNALCFNTLLQSETYFKLNRITLLQIKPELLCSHMFPGLQHAANFKIHLGKKYSSLEEPHSKMSKMERERKRNPEKSRSISLQLRAARQTHRNKRCYPGNWLSLCYSCPGCTHNLRLLYPTHSWAIEVSVSCKKRKIKPKWYILKTHL